MSDILSKIESFRDSCKRKGIINNFTDSTLLKSEKLKGGLADNKSYKDIAEKHKVSLDHIKSQVKIGIEVEKEHSSDMRKIIEIVKDHLMENANYYTHLKEMEKNFKKGHKYIRRESDGKGGWNYIYKEQNIKNERTEEIEIKRLSPEEEQGRLRGGSTNVEATKILRGYEISDSTEPERIDNLISKQEEILTKYAKENGKWIDYDKISDKESFGGGEEAKVFMNEDRVSVTKVYDYKLFSISPLEFLDNRISLHNHLFPDTAYELIGFTNRPDRGFSFIVKQPFIDGKNTPVSEISKELSKMGFKDIGGNTYVSDDYIIDDLHKRNVFTKGGRLFFIDTVISLNEEDEGYGGKRRYNNDIEKAISDLLEKAWKKQPIGTISIHKDGRKYKKVSETGNVKVDWKLVTQDKSSTSQENGSRKERIADDNSTKLSKDQLAEHAKNTSEQALQSTIKNSPNEEERKVAHEELDRRSKEEHIQEDEKPKEKIDLTDPRKVKEEFDKIDFTEKFRQLSDEQIKFYLDAPHPKVKEAAKMVADERGLSVVSKEDYIKQFKDWSDDRDRVIEVYEKDADKAFLYLDDHEEVYSSVRDYIQDGFMNVRSYLSNKEKFIEKMEYIRGEFSASIIKQVESNVKNLTKFIEDNKVDKDLVLHRMVMDSRSSSFFSKLKEGDIYEDKSFSSSSLFKLTEFGDFHIKILARKGSNVASVNNRREFEYLIDKESKFRVIEKHENGLGITVELL